MNSSSRKRTYSYDPDMTPVMTISAIREMMPDSCYIDRIDKVLEISADSIICIKCITIDETFFMGHFPKEPVLPGVFQIETMVQSGYILLHNKVQSDDSKCIKYSLLEMNDVKFRQKVIPGDFLIVETSIEKESGNGMVTMHGACYVGTHLVSEATFTVQRSNIERQ